ncbi:hypothetical protein AOCH_005197, partial [Aspergillus ochraceoroseus]
ILEDPLTTPAPPPTPPTPTSTTITPYKTTLRDSRPVTLYPFYKGRLCSSSPSVPIPQDLLHFLHGEFSAEIERGCTYPMDEAMSEERFTEYWFGGVAVVAVLDASPSPSPSPSENQNENGNALRQGRDWGKECLGTFYIKANYPGRCSHVCNAGFLTTSAVRNQGVGLVMGQAYLHFAPLLGYKYSVFNLVFENNIASVKIWEKLGFSVIGRVPGAARLANSEELVDALIIGKDLLSTEAQTQ